MHGISAIIIAHNEENVIEECLESLNDVIDEIIVVHDGECKDKTVKIAEEYTRKIKITEHKGRSAFNFITGLKMAKYNWILKIDADESLSNELQKNIRSLALSDEIDAFSFIHPHWDGEKVLTKSWPRKTVLVRKSKISYLAFPGFDASINVNGEIKETNFVLHHKSVYSKGWKAWGKKVLGRYAPSQAEYLLKDFREFDTWDYFESDFPLRVRIRRTLPLLTNIPYAFLVLFKQLFKEGAIKEGWHGFDVCLKTFIFNVYLGWLLHKKKRELRKG